MDLRCDCGIRCERMSFEEVCHVWILCGKWWDGRVEFYEVGVVEVCEERLRLGVCVVIWLVDVLCVLS